MNICIGKDLDNTGTLKGEIKLSKIQIVEDVSGGSLSGQNGFPFQVECLIINEGSLNLSNVNNYCYPQKIIIHKKLL